MVDTTLKGMFMDYDKIYIKDLSLRCILGINKEERIKKQDISINVVMYTDLSRSCASDDIADTVNYKTIKLRILDLAETSSFYLIEKLAQGIADICLEERMVEKVDVRIDKPGALRFAVSAAVEITRCRES